MIVSNPQQRCRGLARGRHGLWDNPESETPPSLGPGVLSSGWCPLPSSEGSYIHPYTHQERRGSMKTAESGSPPPAPPCPLRGQIQRAEPGPQKGRLERAVEFQGLPGFPRLPESIAFPRGLPRAPLRRVPAWPAGLPWRCPPTCRLSNSCFQPRALATAACCHTRHFSLSPPSLKGFAITAQDGTCMCGIHACVRMHKHLRAQLVAVRPRSFGGGVPRPPPTPSPTGLAKAMPCPS